MDPPIVYSSPWMDHQKWPRARSYANTHLRGTLGLVLAAKQQGHIPAAQPVIAKLRETGMYLSDRVVTKALALVGETL